MDPIALGTLIVAALGLLAGGIKAFHSLFVKRTKTRFEVEQYSEGPFYIHQIAYSIQQKKASVRSIATWLRVRFINATSSPMLLSNCSVFEDYKSKRQPVSLPYRKGDFHHQDAKVSEALQMPCRIESQDGLDFYILVDVRIPQKLGEMLFELYCKNIDLKKLEKETENLRNGALQQFRKDISIVEVANFEIPQINLSDPIVRERNDIFSVLPMFGIIPFGARLELVNACAEKDMTYPREPVPPKYYIEICMGDGRNLRQIFRTNKNPMWFMKSKN